MKEMTYACNFFFLDFPRYRINIETSSHAKYSQNVEISQTICIWASSAKLKRNVIFKFQFRSISTYVSIFLSGAEQNQVLYSLHCLSFSNHNFHDYYKTLQNSISTLNEFLNVDIQITKSLVKSIIIWCLCFQFV